MRRDCVNLKPGAVGRMRDVSGSIKSDDPLVIFLYELARDHITTGVIDGLIDIDGETSVTFTNGWLAEWAKDASKRLTRSEKLVLCSNCKRPTYGKIWKCCPLHTPIVPVGIPDPVVCEECMSTLHHPDEIPEYIVRGY